MRRFVFLALLTPLVGCTADEPDTVDTASTDEWSDADTGSPGTSTSAPGEPSKTTVRRAVTQNGATCPGGILSEVDLDDRTAPSFPEMEGSHEFDLPETTMAVQVEGSIGMGAGTGELTLAWNGKEVWHRDVTGVRAEDISVSIMGNAGGRDTLSTPGGGAYTATWSATGAYEDVVLAFSAVVCAEPVIPA